MAIDDALPVGWADMDSVAVGSATRDTNEPGGSRLLLSLDVNFEDLEGNPFDDPIALDFIDFSLPSLKATAYSTAMLAQKKWMTMGVSRLIDSDQITGTIECSHATYALLCGMIGAKATARIEIPNQNEYSQWRVAILSVDGPAIRDGDRMTSSITLTVTNTAPDDKSEMGPVFGTGVTAPADAPGSSLTAARAP